MIINHFNLMAREDLMKYLFEAEGEVKIHIEKSAITRCVVSSLSGIRKFPDLGGLENRFGMYRNLGVVLDRSRPDQNTRVVVDYRGTRTISNSTRRTAPDHYVFAPNIPLQVTPILDITDDE